MSTKLEAWNKIGWRRDLNNQRNTVSNYETFFEYEKVVETLGYKKVPDTVAKMMFEYKGNLGRDCRVLDIGAGSGLVGKALRDLGYVGELHGIDGSSGMLEQAKLKNIYDKIFCQYLSEETPMSVENQSYDGAMSSASFSPGYVDFKVIIQVVKALKSGGILIVSVSENHAVQLYQKKFEAELENLRDQGLVTQLRIETIDLHNYSVDYIEGITADEDKKKIPSKIYCYEKN